MDSLELTESFSEFKELKNIDKQTMQHVLEDVFRAMLKKKFNKRSRLLDITVEELKSDVGIENPLARELSNKLKQHQSSGKLRCCCFLYSCILLY